MGDTGELGVEIGEIRRGASYRRFRDSLFH